MKIAPEEVLTAYRETGITALRSMWAAWNHGAQHPMCGCPLSALFFHKTGTPLPTTYLDFKESKPAETAWGWAKREYGDDYRAIFIGAFDTVPYQAVIGEDVAPEFREAEWDAIAVRVAMVDAGLLRPDGTSPALIEMR